MTKNKEQMSNNQTGQSLVEFAIIAPIFLLLLLGVFEVGWALRGYLTLVSANREATRFASRGIYLDFDQKVDSTKVGYEKIVTHTVDSLAGQLDNMSFASINPNDNATMIVTYYSVKPQTFLCPGDGDCANFDCDKFLDPNYTGIADEAGFDIAALNDVEYPLLIAPAGYDPPPAPYDPAPSDIYNQKHPKDTATGLADHYEAIPAYHYHTGGPYWSRIDPIAQTDLLVQQTNQLNCELKKKGLPVGHNKNIVVENFFYQKQLVGLPFITAFIPEDIPLYTHTVMRLNPAAREVEEQTTGTCTLYPVMMPNSLIKGSSFGDPVTLPLSTSGGGTAPQPGNPGWILWNPNEGGTGSEQLLEDYFSDPSLSSDYQEPGSNPLDTAINAGDLVAGNTGISAGVKDLLEGLVPMEMLFPVWSDGYCTTQAQIDNDPTCYQNNSAGQGSNATFKTYTFVKMVLTEAVFTGSNKHLTFEFVSFEPNACPGDGK